MLKIISSTFILISLVSCSSIYGHSGQGSAWQNHNHNHQSARQYHSHHNDSASIKN